MGIKIIARNKRATFDYNIDKKFTAGLLLNGWEIKSIRLGKVNLQKAFILVIKNEMFLKNCEIKQYMGVKCDETSDRKLLLNRHEINRIKHQVETEKLQIVPMSLYLNENGWAKLEFGIGKSKRLFEKRNAIKKLEESRKIAARLKKSI